MAYSTTELNKTVKETYDALIHQSYAFNNKTMKRFQKEVVTEDITALGRKFSIQVGSNESYGSQASEGAAFPAAVNSADVNATVNYRSQFASFDFTGDVEDLATKKTLQDALKRRIKDTTESFDEKQAFFLFGDGNGVLGQIDSVSSNAITMLNSVTYGHGARGVRTGMILNAYDVSGAAYRSGDMTVSSVVQSTNIVNVDSAAASIASDDDDVLVFKGSYGYAPQGFAYHVADSGTWLTLSRTTYPTLRAIVHDAASASPDWDMVDLADLKSGNVRGDDAPAHAGLLIAHPVTLKNLRSAARNSSNVVFNAQIGGTKTADLSIDDVAFNGRKPLGDSWCSPSDMWGLMLEDWAIEEVAPRQLYKHNDGNIFIQKIASSTAYGDAKEGRVYARYNIVCKKPHRQFRIKNINFNTAETRTNRG